MKSFFVFFVFGFALTDAQLVSFVSLSLCLSVSFFHFPSIPIKHIKKQIFNIQQPLHKKNSAIYALKKAGFFNR